MQQYFGIPKNFVPGAFAPWPPYAMALVLFISHIFRTSSKPTKCIKKVPKLYSDITIKN